MLRLKKHGTKILFAIMGVLLVLSATFMTYSFAKYLSAVDTGLNGADVAAIECEFKVNTGDINDFNSSFINATFMQQVSDNAQAVQMNQFAQNMITLHNKGEQAKLTYEPSLVFYLTEEMVNNAMFQIIKYEKKPKTQTSDTPETPDAGETGGTQTQAEGETGGTGTGGTETKVEYEYVPQYASAIYKFNENKALEVVTSIVMGTNGSSKEVPVVNDYASVYAGENADKELVLNDREGKTGLAVLSDYGTNISGRFNLTFNAQHEVTLPNVPNPVMQTVCPITVQSSKNFNYCKLTINTPAGNPDFKLGPNEYAYYGLRLVLLNSLDGGQFNWQWSAEYCKPTVGASAQYDYINVPKVPTGYFARWIWNGTNPELQIAFVEGENPARPADASALWETVSVTGNCIGVTYPCRANVVFTQIQS